jgi:hypothetical protein
MPTHKVNDEIITAAIAGFESQKQQIDAHIAELRQMLDGGPTQAATTPKPSPGKRKISAAARRRMALGQKKRWAEIKGEPEPSAPVTPEAPKPKRRISEEGMKRIIAATKKRWRLAKAAKAQPATTKKAAPKKVAKKAPARKSPTANASEEADTGR